MLYPLDWFAIFLYLAVLLGMGFFFYRKQDSTSEYFLAGRSLGWLPIGVSLMATLNSAVDYIVSPAQILEFGIWITLWSLIPAIIVYPFMVKFVLPFYAQLQLFSAYEYLERRFDVRVRSMTAFVFIVWRICWMAVAVYLPSFLLSTTTGLPVVPTVMVLGVIATLYTVMGGIRAVIWTDVMQCVVMFSGVSIALYLILSSFPGGVGEVIQVCRDEAFLYKVPQIQGVDSTSSWWDWMVAYLHLDMTFTNLLIAGTIAKLAFYTVDQIMVQRYLTAKSVKASKDAFLCNTIAYVIYCLLFVALGMCLFTFYTIHPYPEGKTWDDMFPIFIAHELPVGIAGLVVAAIYAASMSSVDSGINSCTAVIYSDFVHRFGWMKPDDPKEYDRFQMRFSRYCVMGLGVAVTLLGLLVPHLGDSLVEIVNKVVNSFTGPMLAIFLLGMFTQRANAIGVISGAVAGLLVMWVWMFATDLSFVWPPAIGFFVTAGFGYWVSLLFSPHPEGKLLWTWTNVVKGEA